MTPARIRELGDLYDRVRERHGRDVAIESVISMNRCGRLPAGVEMDGPPSEVAWTLEIAAKSHGVTVEDVLGPRRWSGLVAARRAVAKSLRAAGWTHTAIGAVLGGRDHSTVSNLLGTLRSDDARAAAKVREATRAEGRAA